MARTDPRSTAELERLTAALEGLRLAHEAEIIRLASLTPPVGLLAIAKAAGLDRDQIRKRERAAGLRARLPGGRGRAGDPAPFRSSDEVTAALEEEYGIREP